MGRSEGGDECRIESQRRSKRGEGRRKLEIVDRVGGRGDKEGKGGWDF